MADEQQKKSKPRRRQRMGTVKIGTTESVLKAFPILKEQQTRQHVDEFADIYASKGAGKEHTIVEPMYSPTVLNKYAMASGVLRTCIDAMATNIDGFGYTLEYIGPEEGRESAEAQAEYDRVMGVLDHPNGDYSLTDLRTRFRTDKESAGYGAIEIVRNPDDGFPDLLYHVPSFTARITTQDRDETETLRFLPRPGARADNMLKVRKRFRRVVQMANGKPVYFKECGDPRRIDYKTGQPLADEAEGGDATEILMDYIYAPGSRYGAPRWIGDLRSVLGIQESENVNLGYFKDNGIPAMMMFILGGGMTKDGAAKFEEGIRQNRGQAMQQKITLVEVEGDAKAASEDGVINRPDVKTVPLTRERQTDAFFQEYEMNSGKKVRSSFRLPAMFTGLTEEVRYAVAQASLTIAENQVFGPERAQTDDLFNYHILTYQGEPMRYWRFRSNPPRITSEDAVMDAIETFNAVGAMTPNIAIGIANEMFDMQIPPISEDEAWGDQPFELTLSALQGLTSPEPPAEGDDGQTKRQVPRIRKRASRVVSSHKDANRPSGLLTKDEASPRRRRRRRVVSGTSAKDVAAVAVESVNDDEG